MPKITALIVGFCLLGFCLSAAPDKITQEQFMQATQRLSYIDTREREIMREVAKLELERDRLTQIITQFKKENKKEKED